MLDSDPFLIRDPEDVDISTGHRYVRYDMHVDEAEVAPNIDYEFTTVRVNITNYMDGSRLTARATGRRGRQALGFALRDIADRLIVENGPR